jgi:hypothetical protein
MFLGIVHSVSFPLELFPRDDYVFCRTAMPDRSKAADMIAQIEREAEARGFQKGVKVGFDRLKAAIDELLEEFMFKMIDVEVDLDDIPPPKPEFKATLRQMAARKAASQKRPTSKSTVLEIVRRNPGLTGKELVERAANEQTPVNERTLRTALHRLRYKDRSIENREGRWYALEDHGPTLPLPVTQREGPTKQDEV